MRLIYWGGNHGTSTGIPVIVLANSNNSYSGGTIINQEEVDIGDTLGDTGSLPGGGLTINGGIVTQVNGTIAPQAVTLNGSSVLTLSGNNTLTSLTINNIGGTTAPTVNTGGVLTLSSSASYHGHFRKCGDAPSHHWNAWRWRAASDTIDVEPISVNGQTLSTISPSLNIAAVITGTESLNKTGAGILQLSGGQQILGRSDFDGGRHQRSG